MKKKSKRYKSILAEKNHEKTFLPKDIFPLVKKDGLPEIAKKIVTDLKWDFTIAYDEKDAIGRRYRRQDALGTPYCVTVDHQTIEDETVTIRHRDSMTQERIAIKSLFKFVQSKLSLSELLKKL